MCLNVCRVRCVVVVYIHGHVKFSEKEEENKKIGLCDQVSVARLVWPG